MIPGEWRRDSYDKTGLVNIRRADSNNHFRDVCQIRTRFKEYFNNDGVLDWDGIWSRESIDLFIITKNTNLQ